MQYTVKVIIKEDYKSIFQIIFIKIFNFWANFMVGRCTFLMAILISSLLALFKPHTFFDG